MKIQYRLILAILLINNCKISSQVSWLVDNGHGHIGFSIKYMSLGDYYGKFKSYNGKVNSKSTSNFTDAFFDIEININSVSAEMEGHETMLKGKDYFNAAEYPLAYFRSTSMKPGATKGTYNLEGNLTIKSITKKITLVAIGSEKPVQNYYPNKTNYAFKISGSINRSDFEIGSYELIDPTGLVLGEEVNIFGTLQLITADKPIPMVGLNKIQIDEKKLEQYVGKYELTPTSTLNIVKEGQGLVAKATGGSAKNIYPLSETRFFYECRNIELEFIRDEQGKIIKLLQTADDKTTELKKLNDIGEISKKIDVSKEKARRDSLTEAEQNYVNRGWEDLMNKDYSSAIEYLHKAEKKEPKDLTVQMTLAHAYLFSSNYPKALDIYKTIIDKKTASGIPFSKMFQEDFIWFKSRKFPTAQMDKAFKDLGLIPNQVYKDLSSAH